MDVKSYRKQIESELKEADATAAGKPAGETLEILEQRSDSAKSRVSAIEQTEIDPENLGPLVRQYLRTISDNGEAVSVRLAALRSLKVMDFLGPKFDGYTADYHEALRGMVDDSSPQVRENAIEVLAISRDSFVKDKLLDGLKDAKKALIPVEKAIQYLAYDEHSEAISTVRGMFDTLGTSAKEQAIRMLASDPESAGLLTKLIRDKSEKSAIRTLSAVGLKNIDQSAFLEVAQEIITNDEDFDEIRAVFLSTLANQGANAKKLVDEGFSKKVEGIKTKSRNLRSTVNRFLNTVR